MAKRNNDNRPIEEILKEFVQTNNLEVGLDKVNVREAWANLMGNGVNNYTTAIELKHETLYVQLSSSVLREELSYGKEKIVKMLNESVGKEIVKKLVLR
ncbi:MAG: RNA-binding protein [Flavobacteriaceae bacterium]|nr:RNA-binding protein [Flavobacteriaceae bacterium]MBD10423.1 RNA-binding protein [Flavobacteriaceae bacterium]|tara:strand:- start:200 stop:496 length:297 start_codon:yes stop_codon:yes gene_type:complete